MGLLPPYPIHAENGTEIVSYDKSNNKEVIRSKSISISSKTWIRHVLLSLRGAIDHKDDNTNMLRKMTRIVQRIVCYKLCYSDTKHQTFAVLTAPCFDFLTFTSWIPESKTWHITVHEVFMINITIYKSFVPYSDLCSPHNVQLHEGHSINNDSLIEKFCGHTYMESVYTKYNRGLLYIMFNTTVIYSAVMLYAGYQIHDQGVAHRHNYKHKSILPPGTVNVKPSLTLHFMETIINIWYMSNEVYINNTSDKSATTDVEIEIVEFVCLIKPSDISIFTGLLPYYLIKWKSQPFATLPCNQTHYIVQSDSMYTTAVLRWSLSDLAVFINISFTLKINSAVPWLETSVGEEYSYSDASLYRRGNLQSGYLRSLVGYLTFTSMEHRGESHTVNQALMAHVGTPNITDTRRLDFTPGTYVS